jgi:hypothetical protein
MENYILAILVIIELLNLIFIISLSNFLVKIADSVSSVKTELEDYYYVQNNKNSTIKQNNQESGLVDL